MLRVITAPSTGRLISLSEVNEELPQTDSSGQPAMLSLIDQVSDSICDYCNRSLGFGQQTVEESWRFNLQSVRHLRLDRRVRPLVSIVSVTLDQGADPLVEGVDFEVDYRIGELYRLIDGYRAYWFSWSTGPITVRYIGGYILPDQINPPFPTDDADKQRPASLRRATLSWLTAITAAQGRDPNLRSTSIPDVGADSWLDPRYESPNVPAQVAGYLDRFFVQSV